MKITPVHMLCGVGACALAFQSCINLDTKTQVKDLRVLALRVDPPEVLYSFFHLFPYDQRGGFPLGPYSITAQALVVDPQGRTVDVSVRLCPEQVDETNVNYEPGCEGYVVRSSAAPEEIRAVSPLVEPRTLERRPELALGGEVPVPPFAMTFTDRALDYMLPHTPEGEFDLFSALLGPTFPSLVLRVQVPGSKESETAFKRFSVGLDISPEGIPPELRENIESLFEGLAGVPFCPDEPPESNAQCIKRRLPNRNPTITRVLYRVGGGTLKPTDDPTDVTSGGQLKDVTGRIEVAPGQTVRLRPVAAEGDEQPYQAFAFDIQNSRLVLRNYKEDMAFSWFTTVGDVSETTTTQFTRTADGSYEVSPDAPDGPAHVWVVLRDQRGGVDWRRVDFMVKANVGGANGGPPGPFGG